MYNMSQSNNNPPNNTNDAPSSYIRMGSMSDEGSAFNISRRGSSLLYPMLRDNSIVEHPGAAPTNGTSNSNPPLFSYLNDNSRSSLGLPRNESISQFFTGFNSRSNSETQTPNFTTSQQQLQQLQSQPQPQSQLQPQQYPPSLYPVLHQQYPPPPHAHQSNLPHPMNPPPQPHPLASSHHPGGPNQVAPAPHPAPGANNSTNSNAAAGHHIHGPPHGQAGESNMYSGDYNNHRYSSADSQYYEYPGAQLHPHALAAPAAQAHPLSLAPGAAAKDPNLDPLSNRRSSDQLDSFNPLRQRGNSSYFNRPRQLSILPFQDSLNEFDNFLKRDSIRGLMNYNGGDLLDHYPNFPEQDFQLYRQHSRSGSSNGFNTANAGNGRFSASNLMDPTNGTATGGANGANNGVNTGTNSTASASNRLPQQQSPPTSVDSIRSEEKKKPKRQNRKRKTDLDGYSFPKNEKANTPRQTPVPAQGSPAAVQQQGAGAGGAPDRLMPLQEVMHAEDGRPLLGATKVDQLMLVIELRKKGINKTIPRGEDGSILADQQNGVIPQPIDLVGGVEKHTIARNKNYQCNYCMKKFTQSTHLEVHVRSHIGYKPYECSFCGKRFTQGGNLRTHLRLHTGERPFHCDICDRKFSRKGNLQAHKLTHDNLKPFECRLDNCSKSFTQLGNLKSHQNRFHLETLNELTRKLADLGGSDDEDILFKIENLPYEEQDLLKYFTSTYRNLNRGIRGRGKKNLGAGGAGSGNESNATDSSHSPSINATEQTAPVQ